MHPEAEKRRTRLRRIVLAGVFVIAIIVIWLDVATGLWSELVVLSGVAAGLLTFGLSSLTIDRILAKSEHERWLPVTRLALTDILHALADEEASEFSRGKIVPRTLDTELPTDFEHLQAELDEIHEERELVTTALAQWSQFLASSADVHAVMTHVAAVSQHLDDARDALIEFETQPSAANRSAAETIIRNYNAELAQLVREIENLLR